MSLHRQPADEHIIDGILEDSGRFGRIELAGELMSMFTDAGPLIGLAIVAYLLAPEPDTTEDSSVPPPLETRA